MAKPDLHEFKKDLQNKPADKSNAPPRSIRADDLDGNFTKATVIESSGIDKDYDISYTKRGTILFIFPQKPRTGTHVLGIIDGELQWLATEDC
jgi:hypothetical protein